MTQQTPSVDWATIPRRRQQHLIALMGQLAYRALSRTVEEDRSDERQSGVNSGRQQQNSRVPPRSPRALIGLIASMS